MEIINLASIFFLNGFHWVNDNGHDPIILKEISPAVVSYNSHTLHYSFNLTVLYDISENMENELLPALKKKCEENQQQICNEIVKQLELDLKIMKEREKRIEPNKKASKSKRSKEPFERIKHLFNKRYTKINSYPITHMDIGKSTDKTVNLTIELTRNDKQKQNYTESMIIDMLNILEHIVFREIKEHNRLTTVILNTLNAENQFMEDFFQLISVKTFRADVKALSAALNGSLETLIENDNISLEMGNLEQNIFKISYISKIIQDSRLNIYFTFPTWQPIQYKLFKIVPIPIRIKNQAMILSLEHEYVALDKNYSFTFISETDINLSKKSTNNVMIISPEQKIDNYYETCEFTTMSNRLTLNSLNKCNFEPIPNENYIVAFWRQMFYIYHTSPTKIKINCNNNSTHNFLTRNNGILFVKEDCNVKFSNIEVIAETLFTNETKEVIKPKLFIDELVEDQLSEKTKGMTTDNSISKKTVIYTNPNKIFRKLVAKTKVTRELNIVKIDLENNINEHFYNIIKASIITGITTLVISIAIIYTVYKKLKSIDWWINITNKLIKDLQNPRVNK